MPGWFDVFDWPIGLDAKDDPKGLAQSVRSVEKIVKQLEEEEGIHPSRVVIGGFSQGGAVALMAGKTMNDLENDIIENSFDTIF